MATAKPASATKKTTAKKTGTAKRKTKTASKKSAAAKSAAKKQSDLSPQEIELMNETGRRRTVKEAPKVERRQRRRQIDPTTCEREYSDPEIEFMHAMDDYKRASGRMFPTCSEILEVITRLGYRQIESAEALMYDPDANSSQENEDDQDWDSEDDE